MKKSLIIITMLAMVLFSSCGKTSETVISDKEEAVSSDVKDELVETEVIEESDVQETKVIKIYYSNEMADGLEHVQVEVEAITPEVLLSHLSEHNIVTKETKSNSVEAITEGEDTVLLLDLSKEFGEYVSSMGTSGEYVIIAALTNTFLEAYEAQALRLTVEGAYLESGHAVYDWDLNMFQETF